VCGAGARRDPRACRYHRERRQGAALLLVYSIGLGLPFILTALLFGTMGPLLSRLNRHALVINRVAGILLIAVGVLILTGQLSALTGALARVLPEVAL
jgi:cytochrome c-type biogenesis protein